MIILGTCGPPCAPRYFLIDQDHNYWNENGWTTNRREAALFADVYQATSRLHDLMLTQVPGELFRFTAPIRIEMKTAEPVNLKALQDWLDKAVRVFMDAQHGTGPGHSMVMMHIDWDAIKETSHE